MRKWRFRFQFASDRKRRRRGGSTDITPEVNCVDNTFGSAPKELSKDAQTLWAKYGGDRSVAKSFWIEKDQAPLCELEKFALQVGEYHMGDEYLGVEYWVQLRREKYGDDDGKHGLEFHFDKDETSATANEDADWHHPVISTVTYLDCLDPQYPAGGVPLVVFQTRADGEPAAFPRNAWIIPPLPNRHVSFEGNLLHGCPYDVIQHLLDCNQDLADPDDKSNPFNRITGAKYSRLSIAVNIWKDHKPKDIKRVDAAIFANKSADKTQQKKKQQKNEIKKTQANDDFSHSEEDMNIPFMQSAPAMTRSALVSSQTDTEDLFFLSEHRDGDTNPLPIVEVGECFVNFLEKGWKDTSEEATGKEDVLMVHYLDH